MIDNECSVLLVLNNVAIKNFFLYLNEIFKSLFLFLVL